MTLLLISECQCVTKIRHWQERSNLNTDTKWVASGYHPRNDVCGSLLEVPKTNNE